MIQRILVPLDNSPVGEQALPMAVALARRLGAALRLVHVATPVLPSPGRVISIPTDLADELKDRARELIDAIAARVLHQTGLSAEAELLDGPVVEALESEATAWPCDLVVMTTHGRGPLARAWLGSVTDALVRRLIVPILVVRPQETPPALSAEPSLRRILVPLDGSTFAEQVLNAALEIAPRNAQFTLVQIVVPPLPGFSVESPAPAGTRPERVTRLDKLRKLYEDEIARAHAYLNQKADEIRARGADVQTHVIEHEQPATAILNAAQANSSDLIALSTHGQSGFRRLLMGSTTDKVLRGTTLPVLVLRPSGAEADM